MPRQSYGIIGLPRHLYNSIGMPRPVLLIGSGDTLSRHRWVDGGCKTMTDKKSRKRLQLNIELADSIIFDQLSQVADNVGISKRDIVEELIIDFLGQVKRQSPLLLVDNESDPVDRIEALLAYKRIKDPGSMVDTGVTN
jgi:hypothetical protein